MEKQNNQLALLVNGKSTKELIKVEVHTQIHQSIDEYLCEDRFNYLVTTDNLKEVKSNNTELNASIKVIKDFGKKLVDLESEDINTFKSNIKEYWEKIEAKRQSRIKEIEVFENETKLSLVELIVSYILEQYTILNIKNEFQSVSYNDLILISNITAKGALTKGVKDSLNMRLQICKSSQDKYDMRVLQLENICYKMGLETPLTVNHIQGIIYEENDDIYNDKLTKLINDELERVENIKLQLQKKADNEAKEKVNAQIKIANDTFLQPWGMMELETLENKRNAIANYDISVFNLCLDHAKTLQERAITFINQTIWGKRKVLEDSKKVIEDMITPFDEEKKEVVIAVPTETQNIQVDFDFSDVQSDENIQDIEPFVPYEKDNTNEDEKILVAKFKIAGTTGLTNDEVLAAVRDILFNAGICDDSLVTLEVL